MVSDQLVSLEAINDTLISNGIEFLKQVVPNRSKRVFLYNLSKQIRINQV